MPILTYLSIFSACIPIIVGMLLFTKKVKKSIFIIIFLVSISFLSDLVSLYFAFNSQRNYWVINIYRVIEILLIGYFFYLNLGVKKIVLFITILFLLVFLYLLIFVNFNSFYGSTFAIHAIINIALCLMIFYEFYKNEQEIFIDKTPLFWLNIGFLAYFAGALFSFLLSNYLLTRYPEFSKEAWKFHNIANILKNILFAIGLWKVRAVV